MATDRRAEGTNGGWPPGLETDLASRDWSARAEAIHRLGALLRHGTSGESLQRVAGAFHAAAEDPKWEVRAAVAHESAWLHHPSFEFERTLGRLAGDPDLRVSTAAEVTLRRRQVETPTRPAASGKVVRRPDAELLARGVLHDVGTLCAAQGQALGALLADLEATGHSTSRRRELLEAALLRCQRTEEVVGLNLDLSRVGKPELQREVLRHLVQAAVGDARAARPREAALVEFEIEVDPGLSLDTHRGLLVSAMTNVLTNSLDALAGWKGRGRVSVSARVDQGRILLDLVDDGPGMSKRMLAVLGHPGKRPEPAPGRGYGFASALKAVDDCQGRIEVDSKRWKGTRVTFVLPCPADAVQGESPA